MSNWEIVETDRGTIIKPKKELRERLVCSFCGTKLLYHDFHVSYEPNKHFWHADVHYKCPECGHWVTFGISITDQEANALSKSKLHAKTLTDEVLDVEELSPEDEERIRMRLEQMGYWGG